MDLASRTPNTIALDATDAPTGLDRVGRSRDEAAGPIHRFAWRSISVRIDSTWDSRLTVAGAPSLRDLMASTFGRLREAVDEAKARIRRLIEADLTRFLGLVGREAYFKSVHVRISDTHGRVDRVVAVRLAEGGPGGPVEVEDVTPAEAVEAAAAAAAHPEAPPPDLPRVLAAGGQCALHLPLN